LFNFLQNKGKATTLLIVSLFVFSFIQWQFGMLLFHTLIEFSTVYIGFMMFTIAMNTKNFSNNSFLVFLGIGFLFVSLLDIFHVITVPGMAFFPEINKQTTLHLWIYARFFEAVLLLSAPWFLTRKLNEGITFLLFTGLTLPLIWLSFAFEKPILITEDGLTAFKNMSEYLIIFVMLLSIGLYVQKKSKFSTVTYHYLLLALVFGITSEYVFTLYANFNSFAFTLGHLLKLISFWSIYQAIVQKTLNIPIKKLSRASSSYDVLPHPAVSVNSKGFILHANEAAITFAKLTSAQASDDTIIGRHVHNIFHPKEMDEKNCELCHSFQDTNLMQGEAVYFAAIKRWYEFYNRDFSENKTEDEKISVQLLVDVTEMKEAYSKLSNITQQLSYTQKNAQIGSWRLNIVTNELWWSDEVFTIFEIDKEQFSPSYEAFLNVIHPQDRELVNDAYLNSLKSKQRYQIEHRLLMEDGRVKVVLEQCMTTFDENGSPLESSGSVQDITDFHQMAEALKQAEKMDALGKLTGGVAHDFNNLLGIILGYSEILHAKLKQDEKLLGYVKAIEKAGNRGADLTRKLLSFSKQKSPDISRININNVIDANRDMLSKTLTATIEFETHLLPDLWDIEVNINDLDDILLNLCINSAHAMPTGGKLTLTTSNVSLLSKRAKLLNLSVGDYVCLAITDTGCGMSDAVKNMIFEPFFTTKKEKGTGLGLSQVYGFIQSASGAINIDTEEGVGTCFMLYFPRHASKTHNPILASKQKLEVQLTGNETILVVDDEKALAELAQQLLQTHGYQVFIAENAEEALNILKQHPVDLLLSDIIMPQTSGFELAKQVNVLYPNIKILLASGYQGELTQMNYEGVILQKPYDTQSLLVNVRKLLGFHYGVSKISEQSIS